ncbi:CLC_0170 family protein [Paenibacillus monticola]|uniref:Uncharacterized protein n=1 Tax=Paenibacillus monticola TaxID=2666075 RepID=A0A7X2H384_9BACL|nr:CLC_0170 family protein [Paenibacillus monticola]MRN51903.1 hypothetical protein [Paenibacillus monticola]
MFRELIFVAFSLFFSGVLLLTVDMKIYAVNHMRKEKKLAHILGWVQICLMIITILTLMFTDH